MKMFDDVHAIEPDVKLFLNDFGIMEARGCQKATVGRIVKMANLMISSRIIVQFVFTIYIWSIAP